MFNIQDGFNLPAAFRYSMETTANLWSVARVKTRSRGCIQTDKDSTRYWRLSTVSCLNVGHCCNTWSTLLHIRQFCEVNLNESNVVVGNTDFVGTGFPRRSVFSRDFSGRSIFRLSKIWQRRWMNLINSSKSWIVDHCFFTILTFFHGVITKCFWWDINYLLVFMCL
jgi:hypothetical protein